MAQLSSTMDQEPGPTLCQVGSSAETASFRVMIRIMETMQTLIRIRRGLFKGVCSE